MPTPLAIYRRRLDHPDGLTLIEQVQNEYVLRYGSPDEAPIEPDQFEDPEGAFFIGYEGELPVAMGGWRRHAVPNDVIAASAVELKRMFVIPQARGRGHARAMLAHLEASAAVQVEAIILETGLRQPEAIALYESCGYLPIRGFGYYAAAELSRCFSKRLAHSDA